MKVNEVFEKLIKNIRDTGKYLLYLEYLVSQV